MKRKFCVLLALMLLLPAAFPLLVSAEYGSGISLGDITVDRGTITLNVDACVNEWLSEQEQDYKNIAKGNTSNIDLPLTLEQIDNIKENYGRSFEFPENVTLRQAMFIASKEYYNVTDAQNMSEVYYKGLIPFLTRIGGASEDESKLKAGLKYGTDFKMSDNGDTIAKKIAEAVKKSAYAKNQFDMGLFGNYYKVDVPAVKPGYITFKTTIISDDDNVTAKASCETDKTLKATVTPSGEKVTFKLPVKAGQIKYSITLKAAKEKNIFLIINSKADPASSIASSSKQTSSKSASSKPASSSVASKAASAAASAASSQAAAVVTIENKSTGIRLTGPQLGKYILNAAAVTSGASLTAAKKEFTDRLIEVYTVNITMNNKLSALPGQSVISIPLPTGVLAADFEVYSYGEDKKFSKISAKTEDKTITFKIDTMTDFILVKKKSVSTGGIVLAVILDLGIAAGAVYIYLKMKKERDDQAKRLRERKLGRQL